METLQLELTVMGLQYPDSVRVWEDGVPIGEPPELSISI
jgi:hypothetical protein